MTSYSRLPTESAVSGDGLVIPDPDLTVPVGESPSQQSVDLHVAPPPIERTSPPPTLLHQKFTHVSRPPNQLDCDRLEQPLPY